MLLIASSKLLLQIHPWRKKFIHNLKHAQPSEFVQDQPPCNDGMESILVTQNEIHICLPIFRAVTKMNLMFNS